MPTTPSILIYGHDAVLLDTRRLILAMRGYEMHTTGDGLGMESALLQNHFRLLILCHTLTLSELRQSLALARARERQIPSLLLIAYNWEPAFGIAGNLFYIREGPARFVECVEQLLSGPPARFAGTFQGRP
jgi:hypothetical protein